jgi:hypothetical protein
MYYSFQLVTPKSRREECCIKISREATNEGIRYREKRQEYKDDTMSHREDRTKDDTITNMTREDSNLFTYDYKDYYR